MIVDVVPGDEHNETICNSKKLHFYQSTHHHLNLMNCAMTGFAFHSSLLQGRLCCILEIILGGRTRHSAQKQNATMNFKREHVISSFSASQQINRSNNIGFHWFSNQYGFLFSPVVVWPPSFPHSTSPLPSFLLPSFPPFLPSFLSPSRAIKC